MNAKRKQWTAAELGYVRRWYRRRPTKLIAEHLGVKVERVYAAAGRLGLCEPNKGIAASVAGRIRKLHASGWSDSEISEAVRCSRGYVSELRRKMNLPSNANNARHRARVRAKTLEQCREAGVPNLGALRAKVHRERAEASGWPADMRPRHVQILDLLYDHGPKTRREIADAIGMPWKGSRQSLTSNDPEGSYLAHLMARGFVVCLPRQVQQGGQGQNVSLYMIPPYVRRDKAKRKDDQCQNGTTPEPLSRQSKKKDSPRNCAKSSRRK